MKIKDEWRKVVAKELASIIGNDDYPDGFDEQEQESSLAGAGRLIAVIAPLIAAEVVDACVRLVVAHMIERDAAGLTGLATELSMIAGDIRRDVHKMFGGDDAD